MRKRIALAALVTALTTLLSAGAALGAVEENTSVPVEGIVFEDVCGETLTHISGKLHILITHTENDNRISGTFHFQPQGAKLQDESGRIYSGTGVGKGVFNEPVDDNGAISFTTVDSFKLIGHGKAPNFLVQMVTHMTVNANGEVTVDLVKESEQCK